jgi:chromatin segregation and condensation protein Rec8/ScpA/Scc1 (kleisin family)
MHGVMTLLASLELGKRREVALQQSAHFEELWLTRGEGPEDPEPSSSDPESHIAKPPTEGEHEELH